jgi:lipid A 4'-phosphatase
MTLARMNPAKRLWTSMERHPWLWALAAMAPLMVFPQIDLTVSSWFYNPVSHTFPARVAPFHEWVRRSMPAYLFAIPAATTLLWLAGEALRRPLLGITRRVAAYVVLSLAIGPGLIVNALLKDYWGRPRPSTLQQFGGSSTYVPPLIPSNQCDDNCSFASGHGALGFWPVALAFLAPPRWRPLAMAAALAFGAMVGYVRIAQGGHFVSDVAASAFITIGISRLLYMRFIRPVPRPSLKNNPPIPGETL